MATWIELYMDSRKLYFNRLGNRIEYSYDDFLEAHNLRKNVVESARTALGEDKYLLSIKRAEQTIEEKK